jgi:hypothetical protein
MSGANVGVVGSACLGGYLLSCREWFSCIVLWVLTSATLRSGRDIGMSRADLLAAFALMLLLALSGCASPGGPAEYLRTTATEITLIQWQESSSGHLRGTVIDDQESGTEPGARISVHSAAFTGDLNGTSVSLSVRGAAGQRHRHAQREHPHLPGPAGRRLDPAGQVQPGQRD